MVPPERPRTPLNLQQRSTLAGEAAAAAAEVETALNHPLDPTAAAFFDVDNTVMQGASIFHLARGLHRREFFTTRDILGAAWKQAYFRVVGVEDPEHVAEARSAALGFIAGHTVKELEELGEEIFDEAMAHRIWPGTRALAQLHLDQGQRVWLVTAAPVEIAQIIARRLGLTGAMGTVAEHVGRRLHRQAGRRHAARPGQGRGDQGAGRPRVARPRPLLGVLRLLQRPADARPGRRRRAPSTRTPSCAPTPASRAGGSATTGPVARPRGPASWSARWPEP